jgi:hypothetical protein
VIVGGKPGTTRERCVEADEARLLTWAIEEDSTGFSRMVSDWRAGFALERVDGGTRVTARSDFRPTSLPLRLLLPVVRRKFHRTQRAILASLEQAVASGASTRRGEVSVPRRG